MPGKITIGAGALSLLVVLIFQGGKFQLPVPCLILAAVAILAGVLLNQTIYGRYLLALGNNVEAARFSGINTDRMVIMAYVICSFLAVLLLCGLRSWRRGDDRCARRLNHYGCKEVRR